jgi:hypothetical protein
MVAVLPRWENGAEIMKGYKRISFGAEGVAYVREYLQQSNTLAHYLETIDLEGGHTSTWLPEHVDPVRALRFSTGGILAAPSGSVLSYRGLDGSILRLEPVPNLNGLLSSTIATRLRGEGAPILIFGDVTRCASDPGIPVLQNRLKVRLFGEEVYYLLTKQELGSNVLLETITQVHSPTTFFGAMSRMADAGRFSLASSDSITKDEIAWLATHAQLIIVGAYDGEGFVLWEREHEKP